MSKISRKESDRYRIICFICGLLWVKHGRKIIIIKEVEPEKMVYRTFPKARSGKGVGRREETLRQWCIKADTLVEGMILEHYMYSIINHSSAKQTN